MIVLWISAALAMQASPAPNSQIAAGNEQAAANRTIDDPERVICRRERVVGTNRPQRTCMTARQWDAAREASREALDKAERGQVQVLPRT